MHAIFIKNPLTRKKWIQLEVVRHHSSSLVSHSQHVLKTICMIIRRKMNENNNLLCASFVNVRPHIHSMRSPRYKFKENVSLYAAVLWVGTKWNKKINAAELNAFIKYVVPVAVFPLFKCNNINCLFWRKRKQPASSSSSSTTTTPKQRRSSKTYSFICGTLFLAEIRRSVVRYVVRFCCSNGEYFAKCALQRHMP